MRPKTWLFASALALTVAVVAGCSPSSTTDGDPSALTPIEHELPASVLAQAKTEGSVLLYSALDETILQRVKKDFGARYGIGLTWVRGPSATITQRFLSELQAGTPTADVVDVAADAFFQSEMSKNTFVSLDAASFPAMAGYPEDAFVFNSFRVQINPYEIAYNTDRVQDTNAPRTYEDLTKPQFKGLLGQPTWTASISYPRVLDFFARQYGDRYLTDFVAQQPKQYDSVVPAMQALAAGEIGVYPLATPSYLQPLLDQGAPLKAVMPAVTTGYSENVAIPAKAPHPTAARVFMNYAMSAEGQKIIQGATGVSMLPGASELKLPSAYVAPPVSVDAARTKALYQLVGAAS
ncbi:ABC transporter substrate-binding protein [Dactylosporangium salmoneum]|uniref:Extracellular solute-binding protein n=1 Tax=Dactylosporangium salmoneum TaxID=53361 RepID=A0ABN3FXJ7_9ACTN